MVDRLTVRFVTSGRDVVEFAVQYDAFIDGKWCTIVRCDNAHGEAHRHVYYPDGTAIRVKVNEADHNLALTNAYEAIKANFQQLWEQYIIKSERNRQ